MKRNMIYVILLVGLMGGCSRSDQAENIQTETVTAPARDYVQEGLEYLRHADPKAAIKSFDEAIRQNPTDLE